VAAHWRVTMIRHDGLLGVRFELVYDVVDPTMAELLASTHDAGGRPKEYVLHNSAFSVYCTSKWLCALIHGNAEIQEALARWTETTTYDGLVTLRFGRVGLTGKGGSPSPCNTPMSLAIRCES
jgi:hypothetical protein